jgi:hypothetical protein
MPPACADSTVFEENNEERERNYDAGRGQSEYYEERESKCSEDAPVLCPSKDEVPVEYRGTCQEILLDCFGTSPSFLSHYIMGRFFMGE